MSLFRNLGRALGSRPGGRGQQDAAAAESRREITRKLDELAASQAELRQELRDEAEASRPPRPAKGQAFLLLSIAGLAVVVSALWAVNAASLGGQATQLNEQAQYDLLQGGQFMLPLVSIASDEGVPYLFQHANQMSVTDIQSATASFTAAQQEEKQAASVGHRAIIQQYGSQTALALTGAAFGAVAGWIITVTLGARRAKRGGDGGNAATA